MQTNNKSILTNILKGINQHSCPDLVNMHCHTTQSDGALNPVELYQQAISRRLHHIAITDHHSTLGYSEALAWINANHSTNNKLPVLWTGIEISCLVSGCLVHILGLGFDNSNPALNVYKNGESVTGSLLRAESVVTAIKEANGISVLAHPARYRLHFEDLIRECANLGIDGVEVWYDYDFNNAWKSTRFVCDQVHKLTNDLGLLSTCGTDTHGLSLAGR